MTERAPYFTALKKTTFYFPLGKQATEANVTQIPQVFHLDECGTRLQTIIQTMVLCCLKKKTDIPNRAKCCVQQGLLCVWGVVSVSRIFPECRVGVESLKVVKQEGGLETWWCGIFCLCGTLIVSVIGACPAAYSRDVGAWWGRQKSSLGCRMLWLQNSTEGPKT